MTTLAPLDPRAYARMLFALLLTPLALGVVLHLAPGLAQPAQRLLPLALSPGHASAAQALELLATNLRAAALPLLGSVALVALQQHPQGRGQLRALLDVLVGFNLAANALLLAVAIAGYGPLRLAPWLPHLPVEFTALSIAATAYLRGRTAGAITYCQLSGVAGLVAVLLIVAALLETYATPHA